MSSAEDKKLRVYKVVLVGETGVGKTNLITRYIYNTFDQNQVSTVSATYAKKTIKRNDGNEIILQIWDTAGQESYRGLTQLFYRNAAGIIIVYDITRKNTFEEIKNYWLKQVKENASKEAKIAIVGNKNDLFTKGEVDEEECRAFAEKIGAMFQLTSALNSNGVDKLFEDLADALSDNSQGNKGNRIELNTRRRNNDKRRFC